MTTVIVCLMIGLGIYVAAVGYERGKDDTARPDRLPQVQFGEPFLLKPFEGEPVEVVITHIDRDPYGALAFTGMDATTYANNNRWRSQ